MEKEDFLKDSPEGLPEILLDNKTVAPPDPRDDVIHFNDLPKIWQDHILKRRATKKIPKPGEETILPEYDTLLPVNKNLFSRAEILEAVSDENSFTPSALVDKLFERAKKEKIAMSDLPEVWRKILEPKHKFGNVTIEELKRRGKNNPDIIADIEKIKSGFYRQNKEIEKIAELKNDIAENAVSSMIGQPAEWQKSEVGADLTDKPEASKTGWWSKIKSWLK